VGYGGGILGFRFQKNKNIPPIVQAYMAASVLTSHVFGSAKLIFDAGGTDPAKFNIRTDPFAIWTDPFAKDLYIYIYMYVVVEQEIIYVYIVLLTQVNHTDCQFILGN
jgi:hypothetical protein